MARRAFQWARMASRYVRGAAHTSFLKPQLADKLCCTAQEPKPVGLLLLPPPVLTFCKQLLVLGCIEADFRK